MLQSKVLNIDLLFSYLIHHMLIIERIKQTLQSSQNRLTSIRTRPPFSISFPFSSHVAVGTGHPLIGTGILSSCPARIVISFILLMSIDGFSIKDKKKPMRGERKLLDLFAMTLQSLQIINLCRHFMTFKPVCAHLKGRTFFYSHTVVEN